MKVAKGSTRRGASGAEFKYRRRCMVSFDDETFEQVRQMAVKKQISFAEQVRILVEFGLEA